MPAVNGVGKPCAGEPHARFDGRELETAHRSHQGHGDEGHQGKPCGHQRLRDLPSMRVTAPALDPPTSPQSPQTTNPGSTTPGQQLDNALRTAAHEVTLETSCPCCPVRLPHPPLWFY